MRLAANGKRGSRSVRPRTFRNPSLGLQKYGPCDTESKLKEQNATAYEFAAQKMGEKGKAGSLCDCGQLDLDLSPGGRPFCASGEGSAFSPLWPFGKASLTSAIGALQPATLRDSPNKHFLLHLDLPSMPADSFTHGRK